jgi:hypothetical protein
MNNYPVLRNFNQARNLEVNAPIAHPSARISYENFYDANPWNDFPIIVEQPALAKVNVGVTNRHLSYANFMDNNPYNDFVVVGRELIATAPWPANPRVSYDNFYDANPFNDYAVVQPGWDDVEYERYQTVERVVPPAYPVEHVDVIQPPPVEQRYVEYIPQPPVAQPWTEYVAQPPVARPWTEYVP